MARCQALLALFVVACVPGGSGRVGKEGAGGTDPTDSSVTSPTDPGTSATGPTWHGEVAPLLAERCGACHREGGQAPFSVETYAEAMPWGPAIVSSIEIGFMPPFYAQDTEFCEMEVGFLDDIRLSDEEAQLVKDWVDAGMPEGDPVPPPEIPAVETFATWDAELELQEPFAVGGTDDIYECFRIPMPTTQEVWITGVEVIPDNDLVVHHVIVWTDPNDQSRWQAGDDGAYGCSGFPDIFPTEILGTWTPGVQPMRTPEGTGTPMEVGSSLVLNIHYHPTGTSTELDHTKIRLQWLEKEPQMYASWFLVDVPFGAIVQDGPNDVGGAEFRIPAGLPDHRETVQMWFTELLFPSEMTVFAITPHMHFLGTEMLVTIEHTDPQPDDCLVHAPGFRFDFQRDYRYDADPLDLPVIHPDDRVAVQCMYDNSTANPFMADHLEASGASEPHDVYWGEETGDEMCMAIVGLIVPKEGWSPFSWF